MRVTPFDQVVAKYTVVGKTALQRLLEGVHRIDAFANEGAAEKQVLINIRNGPCVGVDTGVTAKQARIARARHAGQADAYPRLQDGVACLDPPRVRVEPWAVQRVLHGTNELLCGTARQLGVGVQGDHIAHMAECLQVADNTHEARVAVPAQHRVQLGELAALALAAHPAALGGVPYAWPVKQIKARAARAWVLAVEGPDTFTGLLEQRLILGPALFTGIHEIAEQGKVQVLVTVGQKAYFQPFDQLFDIAGIGQQGGHHHQREGVCGNTGGVVQPWQEGGFDGQCHQPVHQADGQTAGAQQNRQGHGGQHCQRPALLVNGAHEAPRQQAGQQCYRHKVERQRRPVQQALPALGQRHPYGQALFQQRQAAPHQVETHMLSRFARRGACCLGQFDGRARHRDLAECAMARQALDAVPVVVTAGEVHGGVNARRVAVQRLFDMAQLLDEQLPIDGRQQAQAADAVADGHLVDGLLLGIELHMAFDAARRLTEHLFHPQQRLGQRGTVAL